MPAIDKIFMKTVIDLKTLMTFILILALYESTMCSAKFRRLNRLFLIWANLSFLDNFANLLTLGWTQYWFNDDRLTYWHIFKLCANCLETSMIKHLKKIIHGTIFSFYVNEILASQDFRVELMTTQKLPSKLSTCRSKTETKIRGTEQMTCQK